MKLKQKMKVEHILRAIIREEIGRNYHTLDNDPYSYEDYPGVRIEFYPSSECSMWQAKVTCEFDDTLSTPLRSFNTQEDAQHFVRQHAEKMHRARLGQNIET